MSERKHKLVFTSALRGREEMWLTDDEVGRFKEIINGPSRRLRQWHNGCILVPGRPQGEYLDEEPHVMRQGDNIVAVIPQEIPIEDVLVCRSVYEIDQLIREYCGEE